MVIEELWLVHYFFQCINLYLHCGSILSIRLDSPAEAAKLIKASSSLGLSSGILLGSKIFHLGLNSPSFLGVPIPSEESAAGAKIESAIKMALKEAEDR